MARPISVLEVTPEEKQELERRVRASTTSGRDSIRARIVLMRSEGVRQQVVASRLVSVPSVNRNALTEKDWAASSKSGRGAKSSIPLATVRRVIEEAKSPAGRRRWSTRSLAREVGISAHSVARIWPKGSSPTVCAPSKSPRTRSSRRSSGTSCIWTHLPGAVL